MSQAASPSAKKPYDIQRVGCAWYVARATIETHKSQLACEPGKRGPKGFMSDEALLEEAASIPTSTCLRNWIR